MSSQWKNRLGVWIIYLLVIAGVCIGGWFSRDSWLPLINRNVSASNAKDEENNNAEPEETDEGDKEVLELTEQGIKNLRLRAEPVVFSTYWKTIYIPGIVTHRPGLTDRGITSPIAGVITEVHAYEGDLVSQGDQLFTIRLVSEYLQTTQADLFKAVRETELLNKEIDRIKGIAESGAIPEKRLIALSQDISRQQALIAANRQDLLTRGLSQQHLEQIEKGSFINTITVSVPRTLRVDTASQHSSAQGSDQSGSIADEASRMFEIQELNVELGDQVSAGERLAVLANHQYLYVQGHAFKKESAPLEAAIRNHWPVSIEFAEDNPNNWPMLRQEFHIRHMSNTVDAESRTFDFFIPLTNQSRNYQKNDRSFVMWRFRPGQRARLKIPVEKFDDVLVVPADAIAQEGPEHYVFHQDGKRFKRFPVHLLYRDRHHAVIARELHITAELTIVHNSAEAMNRVLKSQQNQGSQKNFHIHADGSIHEGADH